MKKIAFILTKSELKNWAGGKNYYINLINIIQEIGKFNIYIFCDSKKYFEDEFSKDFKIIENSTFKRYSLLFFIRKFLEIIFRKDIFLYFILKKNNIDILSHKHLFKNKHIKSVGWIPDFQHLVLKEFFSKNDINFRNKLFNKIITNSDLLILSSDNSKKYFNIFFKNDIPIVTLRFPSIKKKIDYKNESSQIENKFIYFPSQYWVHKNHKIIIETCKLLKKNKKNIIFVCSGNTADYRSKNHFSHLIEQIDKFELKDYCLLFDHLDRNKFLSLMKNSIALINPSLFEGWSTTVEEARLYSKYIFLSTIEVHKEQAHPGSIFFNPNDPEDLYNRIINFDNNSEKLENINSKCENSRENLLNEIKEKYINMVYEVTK